MNGKLTRTQISRLLKPVRADRVENKQGRAYVPQHEVRAELIRIFGPGNVDHTMTDPVLVYETRIAPGEDQYPDKGNKPYYYVACYKVGCTLRIRDYDGNDVAEFTEYHIEENAPLPNRGEAHAMAVTSAESYALRRAAISMGDAFGLHLYNGGSVAPLVGGTLQLVGDPDAEYYVPPQTGENPSGEPVGGPLAIEASTGEVTGEEDLSGLPGTAEPHPVENVPNIDAAFNKPKAAPARRAPRSQAAIKAAQAEA